MSVMEIVFDLDDTICFPNHSVKDTHGKYALAKPNEPVINAMKRLSEAGYYIKIHTARRMVTHDGNIDDIISDVFQVTQDWLIDHGVPFAELVFGKPYSSTYYVDDKAMGLDKFEEWMKNEEYRIL